jgi:hypothetical protein
MISWNTYSARKARNSRTTAFAIWTIPDGTISYGDEALARPGRNERPPDDRNRPTRITAMRVRDHPAACWVADGRYVLYKSGGLSDAPSGSIAASGGCVSQIGRGGSISPAA